MNTLEIILAVILCYALIRSAHNRYAAKKLELRLQRLRNALRYQAITGRVAADSPAYLAMDHALEEAVMDSKHVSAWSFIYSFLARGYKKRLKAGWGKAIVADFNENPLLQDFNASFKHIIIDHLLRRHLFVVTVITLISIIPLVIFRISGGNIRQWMQNHFKSHALLR